MKRNPHKIELKTKFCVNLLIDKILLLKTNILVRQTKIEGFLWKSVARRKFTSTTETWWVWNEPFHFRMPNFAPGCEKNSMKYKLTWNWWFLQLEVDYIPPYRVEPKACTDFRSPAPCSWSCISSGWFSCLRRGPSEWCSGCSEGTSFSFWVSTGRSGNYPNYSY